MNKIEKTGFEVGGKKARYVLIICSLLYAVNWMDRQVFSVVAGPMMMSLNLTRAQVGWIQNAFLLSIGICAIPVSYWVDRWSRRKAIAAMAMIWSVATFVTGLGKGFFSVLIPRLVVGFGEAGFGPGGTALIGASYPAEERAHKLGYFNMFIFIGVVGGLIGGGFIAKAWGWSAPFFIFAVPGIILSVLALFMQDYPTKPKSIAGGGESLIKNSIALWKIPSLRWLYIGYGLYMMTSLTVSHWNTVLLMQRFKLSVAQAPLIMAVLMISTMWSAPMGGKLADKWEKKAPGGRMRLATVCVIGEVIAAILYYYIAFIAYKGTLSDMGALMFIGFAFYFIHALLVNVIGGTLGAATQAVAPSHLKALAFGWAMTCMYGLGGGWGSGIAASVADYIGGGQKGDWKSLIIGVCVVMCAGFIGALCWKRSSSFFKEDMEKLK